jgi:hypothetical protein
LRQQIVSGQLAALAAKVDAGFGALSDDEANIVAAVRAQPTGGQVDVPAVAAALAPAIVAAMPTNATPAQIADALLVAIATHLGGGPK